MLWLAIVVAAVSAAGFAAVVFESLEAGLFVGGVVFLEGAVFALCG